METHRKELKGFGGLFQLNRPRTSLPTSAATMQWQLANNWQLSVSLSGPSALLDQQEKLLFLFGQVWDSQYSDPLRSLLNALQSGNNQFVGSLGGLFSLVYIDKQTGEVRLFADRVGSHKLFYQQTSERLIIATSYARLYGYTESVTPNNRWLNQMLHLRIAPGTETLNQTINQVAAGQMHRFEAPEQQAQPKSYWQMPDHQPESSSPPMDEVCQNTRAALQGALSKAGCAEKSVAVLLSGGVDSSLLCALTHELNPNAIAVTPVFPGQDNPELHQAEAVASQLGMQHLKVTINDTSIRQQFPKTLACISQPVRSQSLVAMDLLLAQLEGRFDAVVFGESGDMLFGLKLIAIATEQYRKYKQFHPLKSLIGLASKLIPHDRLRRLQQLVVQPAEQIILDIWSLNYTPATVQQLPGREWLIDDVDISGRFAATDFTRNIDDQHWQNLVRHYLFTLGVYDHFYCMGALTQQYGLQLISPFIDPDVIDIAVSLPGQLYFGSEAVKPVLRDIGSHYYGKELMYAPKKGFPVPYQAWLKGPLEKQYRQAVGLIESIFGKAFIDDTELAWLMVCLLELLEYQQIVDAFSSLQFREPT